MGATLCSCEKNSAAAGSDRKRSFEFTESIAAMDWGKATTYVFGHKTPDVDAVASSLSYAALMRALGHNAVAKVSSPVNRETAFIAKRLGFELPELMKYVEPGTRLILTDHAEFAQSVDGAREAKILQIIDHHTPGNIDTISPKPYVRRKLIGATCTLIWHLYQEAEIEIDDNAARVLFAGVLSDTKNLTKVNTTSIDIIVLNELAKQLHLPPDSVQSLYQEMSAAALDYSGMTNKEIFLDNYKDYEIEGFNIGIASSDWSDYATQNDFFKKQLAVMPEIAQEKRCDMLFSKIDSPTLAAEPTEKGKLALTTASYILYYGNGIHADLAKKIAESAFGKSIAEGICFSPTPLNRKTHVVPMITDIIKNYVIFS